MVVVREEGEIVPFVINTPLKSWDVPDNQVILARGNVSLANKDGGYTLMDNPAELQESLALATGAGIECDVRVQAISERYIMFESILEREVSVPLEVDLLAAVLREFSCDRWWPSLENGATCELTIAASERAADS